MKKLTIILSIFCYLLAGQTIKAQEPVATLEHSGSTQVFYGQSALTSAYNASVNGDQIYLSAGSFTPPTSIAKGVKITGAGHFPIEGKQTQITAGLAINKGADSLRLEGMFINGDIKYDANNTINYVKVIRCNFAGADFQSFSTSPKNYCSFEECFISGTVNFKNYGNNFLLRNSVVKGSIYNINGNALIDGNILLVEPTSSYGSTFTSVNYSIIQNNICLGTTNLFYYGYGVTGDNKIEKNIFISSDPSGVNKATNYTGIEQADIFVNQTGNAISYLHDYHLKTPLSYIGTDGTQVGLYGGLSFKTNGVTSNPSIVSKTIAPATEPNGDLQINITVKAQDN